MTRLSDICRYIRSKNAGPFWITVDLFFNDRTTFDLYVESPGLACKALAPHLGVAADEIRRFDVAALGVIKFSYRRREPQGGMVERDMHGGQYFADLLDVDIEPARVRSA